MAKRREGEEAGVLNQDDAARLDVFDRTEQRRQKRAAVLRVAAAAFNRRGFANTSLDEVASALGVSKPALYQYFKNKQEILYECHLLAIAHGEAGIVLAQTHEGPGFDRLLVYLRRYMKGFFDDLGSCAVLLDVSSLSELHRDEVLKRRAAVTVGVEALVAQGVADGSIAPCDPKLGALFVFGVVNWMSVWYRADGPRTPEEIVDAFSTFFRSGFATQAP